MTLKYFLISYAPSVCRVPKVFGLLGYSIYWLDKKRIIQIKRKTTERNRAKWGLPYPWFRNNDGYIHCLNVLELASLYHRQEKHKEDHQERINVLSTTMRKEEYDMITQGWWEGG